MQAARASAFTGLAALAVAIGIGRFAFTPLLPMMQDDFGLPVAEAGWLASANYLGYLLGALSAIGSRVGAAFAIRAALLVIGVSTLAMGLADQFLLWLVLRLVAGIASAWVLVFTSAWALERLALLGHPQLGGTVYAGVGAGIVAAGGLCLAAMSLRAGSADTWLSLGIASIVATAFIWAPVKAGTPARQVAAADAAATGGGTRWRLVLCYGAFGFGYIIPATFLPAMAKEIVADPHRFGWAWPAFGTAAVLSTVFAARLTRILSYRAAWIGGHLAMALGVVVPLAVAGLPGILLAALLVGGTFMVVTMAGMQEARRVAGPRARPLMAAMTASFALGQILGPLLVSLLPGTMGGLAPSLALAAAVLLLSALALQRREVGSE